MIETVGEDIAEITPARGFSIDLMAGLTVLLGSNMGIPLSTTHCKVGAVVSGLELEYFSTIPKACP